MTLQCYNSSVDSTIFVYTTVVPVNMLHVHPLWCYYWSWYLARQGHQQISTIATNGISLKSRLLGSSGSVLHFGQCAVAA